MSALAAALVSLLPRAMLSIIAALVTEKFITRVLARVLVATLYRLAKLTTNTLDDVTVAEIQDTLEKAGILEPEPEQEQNPS